MRQTKKKPKKIFLLKLNVAIVRAIVRVNGDSRAEKNAATHQRAAAFKKPMFN
ncbi:MAG: hypothetical protein II822_07120 [Prevotella sp.]|nr:hypothetical protein [Prevotella sp.]